MEALEIIACIAIGIIVGMAFESVYQAESRKFDHSRIVALNGENIKLKKENHNLKKQMVRTPTVEVIDIPQPDRTYHQGF